MKVDPQSAALEPAPSRDLHRERGGADSEASDLIGRSLNPLWQDITVEPASSVKQLVLHRTSDYGLVRRLNERWHSRLPRTQAGPWQHGFVAHKDGVIYAVALWHNPSARGLPSYWLELRRLAVADDAPHCTASWMLARMRRWFNQNCPERERLISYQDCDVHKGTIYKAAGWDPAFVAKARSRDRSGARRGTRRDYRSNLNGGAPDGAAKIRWEASLG